MTEKAADQDSEHTARKGAPADAPRGRLRKKLGLGFTLGGLALIVLGFLMRPGDEATPNVVRVVSFGLGTIALVMGLGVLLFGTLKVLSVVKIDLRGERPVFFIGLPFLSVRLTDHWEKGAFEMSRSMRLYLVVPTLVRLILVGVLCFLAYGVIAPHVPFWVAATATAALFIALWSAQRLLRGSEDPSAPARETGSDAGKARS